MLAMDYWEGVLRRRVTWCRLWYCAVPYSKCPAGSAIRAILTNGTVECELDNDGGGDITSVTVDNGLIGGGDVGDLSMSINTSYIQRRVQQSVILVYSSYQSRWYCRLRRRY